MGDKARWILVSDSTPNMMYAGKTKLDEAEIDRRITEGVPIELLECRAMRTLIMGGTNGAFTQQDLITPLSISRGDLRLKIKPQAYFWPDENTLTEKVFMEKIRSVEKAEIAHRAAEAGLVTVDAAGPGGGKVLS